MRLTFNIAYMSGTVDMLSLGALSMARHSNHRFRLVSNGLSRKERTRLQSFCRRHDQLEYHKLSTDHARPHGIILNELFELDDDEFFCFADSDIFAFGAFEQDLEHALETADVLSSCYPTTLDPKQAWPGFTGLCLESPAGTPLATTFFCVCRREPIRALQTTYGIGFETHPASAGLSPKIAALNLPDDLATANLDTAKLLWLIGHQQGLRIRYHALDELVHLGGVGSCAFGVVQRLVRAVQDRLGRAYRLTEAQLQREISQRLKARRAKLAHDQAISFEHTVYLEQKALRRKALRGHLARFYYHFFRWLQHGAPKPMLALDDPQFQARVERACDLIESLYREYGA